MRRGRVVIAAVRPVVDAGRYAVKRTIGEPLVVEADIIVDGHDQLRAVVCHRSEAETAWREIEMAPQGNDLWRAEMRPATLGRHFYTVRAWIDGFATWRERLVARVAAGQDAASDLAVGAALVRDAAARAGAASAALEEYARALEDPVRGVDAARAHDLRDLMRAHDARADATSYEPDLPLAVDTVRARFSTWYEMFPRSAGRPGEHGTLADVRARLPLVASLGFDVLYLAPIHPIGTAFRRGAGNTDDPGPDDPGSPWAIGSSEGGHDAVHPQLGTVADLRALVADGRRNGIDVALDIAFQCSPDHPYVREHPQWFRHRPDGTIQYAENPPKRYRDIYPLDFDTADPDPLWHELLRVVRFWIDQGIRIFRVDNPHTKPFRFWEWLIAEVRSSDPDVIFLSEAFTRPKVMYQLAKLGFTQSYTYFTWRTSKAELTAYFTELTRTDVAEFFRPNLWPNTPDILSEQLQQGGRGVFITRLVLAGTLAASYGIYGPAFELLEARAAAPGSEEYLASEKYQLREWDWDEHAGIRDVLRLLNRIRREHAALQADRSLVFHPTDNDMLIAYSKRDAESADTILTVVCLDPHYRQSGFVDLDLAALGIAAGETFQVHDLLTDALYLWHGSRNYVELDPAAIPAHVFAVRRRIRTERDLGRYVA